ncbi:transmembrane protein, putative [Medicago truncatula]|uniref:Transmembrane protein, putative n=1 Tax=Medicago truncatula TaxID=3880 RepID=G7IIB6_MEDTR|nr:transmembrane protein, putative [Medicago truncatula]
MTMTLASSTLQIRRHEYSGDLNIVILVIFVGIGARTAALLDYLRYDPSCVRITVPVKCGASSGGRWRTHERCLMRGACLNGVLCTKASMFLLVMCLSLVDI